MDIERFLPDLGTVMLIGAVFLLLCLSDYCLGFGDCVSAFDGHYIWNIFVESEVIKIIVFVLISQLFLLSVCILLFFFVISL